MVHAAASRRLGGRPRSRDCRRRLAAGGVLLILLLGTAPALQAYPFNVGHRGGVSHAPENTLPDYEHTLTHGGEWIEIDIWNSLDGIPVLHHDATLDRTTNGTGFVYAHTLAELKALDAGSWYGPEFEGVQIPTMEEGVTLAQQLGGIILLDIKREAYIPTIAQLLNDLDYPMDEVFAWIRYGPGMVSVYKQYLPESRVFFSTNGPPEFQEEQIWERATADAIPDLGLITNYYDFRTNQVWLDLVHSYGLLMVGHGVLSPKYQEAIDFGVDGLVVSNPTLLSNWLPAPDPACTDGIDNDGDGLTDYPEDPGCFHAWDQDEYSPCSDGLDNDGDGFTDYPEDPGCFSAFYPLEDPQCSDGLDNNGDGLTDHGDDIGCFALFDQREGGPCRDGLDNDEDGLVDFPEDPGCDDMFDPDEEGAPAGEVPDGAIVAGAPLELEKVGGGDLLLWWDDSCWLDDDDYEIYEGDLGEFWSHGALACSTTGSTSFTVTPSGGSHYYLVVPRNVATEGSYGLGSDGGQRPPAETPCTQQIVVPCD